MIPKLIDALEGLELQFTSEDIADVLWLASQIMLADASEVVAPSKKNESAMPEEEFSPPSTVPLPHLGNTAIAQSITTPNSQAISGSVHLSSYPSLEVKSTERSGLPFKSPAAPPLPNALGIARALRPFMRRFPSSIEFVLDENATAERIAE